MRWLLVQCYRLALNLVVHVMFCSYIIWIVVYFEVGYMLFYSGRAVAWLVLKQNLSVRWSFRLLPDVAFVLA